MRDAPRYSFDNYGKQAEFARSLVITEDGEWVRWADYDAIAHQLEDMATAFGLERGNRQLLVEQVEQLERQLAEAQTWAGAKARSWRTTPT